MKYEYEAILTAFWCGLPVSTSMKPESAADMVDDANINLTGLKIIFNYIIDAFDKRAILSE